MLALTERINLRTNSEIKNLLTRAASFRGLSLSNFLLEAAQRMAYEVLKGQEQIILSPRDWEKFAEILDDDTPPNPKLQSAVNKYKALQ
ncbi:type II toxin-antitoxin system TacA family antitoxin [Candidatus Thiothrix anitrata]|uniref:DUF1778 domain-containing protein n=1 Tax=Candidatus Thiothrix anitrata TaxID=2823902 RepID=A0ABX7X8P8_9GAMM|nr:DUF1778 domain-containing protein [Candidatus Thiothrix anitrata]QTR51613.1 DUF1778 domain-containing protein [Candidatus Thiothrix anitrata]